MNKFTLYFLVLTFLSFTPIQLSAQDENLIYGKIYLITGKSYEGQIRWDEEEGCWDDMFDSQKTTNPFLNKLNTWEKSKAKKGPQHYRNVSPDEERDEERIIIISPKSDDDDDDDRDDDRDDDDDDEYSWNFMSVWTDDDMPSSSRIFSTQFGNIKTLEVAGRESAKLTFKNGLQMKVEGYSNDVGATLNVFDYELGRLDVDWKKIDRIEFMATPKKLSEKMGDPILGRVKSDKGTFTGYIQWDHDESLDTDKLDGYSEDGKMAIRFKNIKKIKRIGRSSVDVTLKSGRMIPLKGTNDVNSGNRGIIVKNTDFGRVKIGWSEFNELEILDKTSIKAVTYNTDFKTPKPIKGRVITHEGKEFKGTLAYDLDEYWDFEILNGSDDDLEYKIPFSKIQTITPKNYHYSIIVLKNGDTLLLGDSQDVSEDHDGILVFTEEDIEGKSVYIPWKEVDKVILN